MKLKTLAYGLISAVSVMALAACGVDDAEDTAASTSAEASSASEASSSSEVSSETETSVSSSKKKTTLKSATLYCVGDSTMCSFSDAYYYPRYGYGTQLDNYFDTKLTVNNKALSGRSSLSFLSEGNYGAVFNNITKNDYLLIGFGHNDEKSDDSARFTYPALDSYDKQYSDYNGTQVVNFQYNLYENYIKPAKEKGATVILATPIVRLNASDDYTGTSGHVTAVGDYAKCILDLAEDTNTPVVDLTSLTAAKYKELGYNEAIYYHAMTAGQKTADGKSTEPKLSSVDATHINIYGAKEVAYLFAKNLSADCALSNYILDGITEPTKETLTPNPSYVVVDYTAVDWSSYTAATSFATTSKAYTTYDGTNVAYGWSGTAFGDTGGDPAGKGFKASEASGVFSVGQTGTAAGKINASSEGISFLFQQVDANYNFTLEADVKVESVISSAGNGQGFGIMLRDDCYTPVKDASITSNYVAAGMTNSGGSVNTIWSRVNSAFTANTNGSGASMYAAETTAHLKLVRLGQAVTVYATFGSTTYSATYTDFDFTAKDGKYMYVGFFATRGTVISINSSDITFTIDGKAIAA